MDGAATMSGESLSDQAVSGPTLDELLAALRALHTAYAAMNAFQTGSHDPVEPSEAAGMAAEKEYRELRDAWSEARAVVATRYKELTGQEWKPT